jgi:uncharacterized protein
VVDGSKEWDIRAEGGDSVMGLKVTPRASKNNVAGFVQGLLKVHVTAAPADGNANEQVREMLSKILHCPKSAITILRGLSSRRKWVKVQGLEPEEVRLRVSGFPAGKGKLHE